MAVSKGGSSGKESGSYSGNTSFNNSGETAGVTAGQTQTTQNQTQTGTQSGTQTGGFTNGVVDSNGYGKAWRDSNPAGVGDFATNYFQNQAGRGSYTLGDLAARAASGDPAYASYAAPKDVVAGTVDPHTGAAFMGNYTGPWDAVKAGALADYDVGAGDAIGKFRGANAPFAGNNRRVFGENDLTTRLAAGRGALAGSILGQGYTAAGELAQQDASRAAGVQTGNADRALNAGQFSSNMLNQRQNADVGYAYQGDAARDAAASNVTGSQVAGAGARANWLAGGQPLLGQTGTSTGATTGTSSLTSSLESLANTFGINFGATSDVGSGTSSGTKSGSSSQKGGGISAG